MSNHQEYLQGAGCFIIRGKFLFAFYHVHDKQKLHIEEEIYLKKLNEIPNIIFQPFVIFPFFKYKLYNIKDLLIKKFSNELKKSFS